MEVFAQTEGDSDFIFSNEVIRKKAASGKYVLREKFAEMWCVRAKGYEKFSPLTPFFYFIFNLSAGYPQYFCGFLFTAVCHEQRLLDDLFFGFF